MPLKVYIGEKFSYKHEQEIFDSLIKKLNKEYDGSNETITLVGNYYYNNQEIDATIFKKDAVIVIDFKKYGGKIKFSENGKWYADSDIVKGGNKINPFIQIRSNKFALVNFFKNHNNEIIKTKKELNYGHISGMIIFHNPITFDKNSLPENLKKWFFITDYNNCITEIKNISNKALDFTNDEINNIIRILNVSDYYSFDESEDQISKGFESIKTEHELTISQTDALKYISSFIDDESKKVFVLNGAAGTGKTYLIKEIVSLLLEKEKSDFKILTPTGRAASNIREKIIHDIRTIHSLIYERSPEKDQEINNVGDDTHIYELFFDIRENSDSKETVYIVDECSLFSDAFYKNEIFSFGTNHLLSDVLKYVDILSSSRKLILIGDDKQIQRGKYEVSSLNANYYEKEYDIILDTYELKEIVRYKKNSQILKNALKIRDSIVNNIYNEFIIEPDDTYVIKLSKEDVGKYYSSLDNSNSIIIKYTNEDCSRTNQWVKKSILEKSIGIDVGDILMFYKNYFLRKEQSFSDFPEYEHIHNGETGIVKWVSNIPEVIAQSYGKKGDKVRLTFRDVNLLLTDGKERTIKIFENFLFSDDSIITSSELIGLIVRFNVEYKTKNGVYPNPKKIGTKKYYEAIQSDEYFNAARVKHAYSITCHKAQGSEWNNVVVDFAGFTGYKEDFFRWSYTAITRAKDKLYIINEPIIHPYINLNWSDNQSCLDFSIKNILFFNKDSDVKKEIKDFASELNVPVNNSVFLELFAFLNDIFLKNSIVINKIDHNTVGYYVRYYLNENNQRAALNFIFDSKYNFKKPTIIKSATNDETFANQVLKIVCSNESEYKIDEILTEKIKFIKDFFTLLIDKLKLQDIKIISIEHLNYLKRVYLKKHEDLCIIDFYYSDEGFITNVHPVKTTSMSIVNEIKTIVTDINFKHAL